MAMGDTNQVEVVSMFSLHGEYKIIFQPEVDSETRDRVLVDLLIRGARRKLDGETEVSLKNGVILTRTASF